MTINSNVLSLIRDEARKAATSIRKDKAGIENAQQSLAHAVLRGIETGMFTLKVTENTSRTLDKAEAIGCAAQYFKRVRWYVDHGTSEGEELDEALDGAARADWATVIADTLIPQPFEERTRAKFLKTNPSQEAKGAFEDWLKDQAATKLAFKHATLMLAIDATWDNDRKVFNVARKHFLPLMKGNVAGVFKPAARCFDQDQTVPLVSRRNKGDHPSEIGIEHISPDKTGGDNVVATFSRLLNIWAVVPDDGNGASTNYLKAFNSIARIGPSVPLDKKERDALNKALAAITAWKEANEPSDATQADSKAA